MKRTFVSLSIALGLLFSTSAGANAAKVHYTDVKESDNFYPSVQYLLDQKAISRTLPNFRPYENITRGQVSSILTKALDNRLKEVEYSDLYYGIDYIDVPKTDQFYPYIDRLFFNGIMRGYTVGNSFDWAFGINQPLTRGQFAGIMIKAYDIPLVQRHGYKENGAGKSDIFNGNYFTDPWGQQIATLETLGIISGYQDGNFKPNTPIKRSQFANMLVKADRDELNFFNQSTLVREFITLGINADVAVEKLKSLSNNEVLKYIASYKDIRYIDTVNMAATVRKEGEIIFKDIQVKLIVSKDADDKWLINVVKN